MSSVSFGSELQLNASTHGLLSRYGEAWNAAFDFSVSAGWIPIDELVLGVEGAVTIPLPSGKTGTADLAIRAIPVIWLVLGSQRIWSYLRTGLGMEQVRILENFESVLVFNGAIGFAVAPRQFRFHFGFEFTGEVELLGPVPARTIGFGGFIGWRI
jgi:hypothetical protein